MITNISKKTKTNFNWSHNGSKSTNATTNIKIVNKNIFLF